jgi:hypothetical protein
MFIPGKLFQPSLMFVSDARAHQSEAPFMWVKLLTLPTNIRLGWKGLPGTNALVVYNKNS